MTLDTGDHETTYASRRPIQIRCISLFNNFNAKKNHRSLQVVKIVVGVPQQFTEPYLGGMPSANSLSPTQSLTRTFLIHDCKTSSTGRAA